jgi:mono/diheme cytochrome c family protein
VRIRAIIFASGLAAIIGGAAYVYFGAYDVGATTQHTAFTYWMLETGMRRSVERRAVRIRVPDLADVTLIDRGSVLYADHCAMCHGAPGEAPSAYALGLTPTPANLAHTAREWRPAELYWVVRNGIKMSGMPAWQFRLPDTDLWAVVAFLQRLPTLTPEQYREVMRLNRAQAMQAQSPELAPKAADPSRGRVAIRQYACPTCHSIPAIVGANAPVGPPLEGIASRGLIAGMLPNTPENLVRWLRDPQRLNPRTAMPDLGVTERDAQDIAAYLYTLK